MTSQQTEPQLLANVGGSPVGVWVHRGSPQGEGAGSSSLGRPLLA